MFILKTACFLVFVFALFAAFRIKSFVFHVRTFYFLGSALLLLSLIATVKPAQQFFSATEPTDTVQLIFSVLSFVVTIYFSVVSTKLLLSEAKHSVRVHIDEGRYIFLINDGKSSFRVIAVKQLITHTGWDEVMNDPYFFLSKIDSDKYTNLKPIESVLRPGDKTPIHESQLQKKLSQTEVKVLVTKVVIRSEISGTEEFTFIHVNISTLAVRRKNINQIVGSVEVWEADEDVFPYTPNKWVLVLRKGSD